MATAEMRQSVPVFVSSTYKDLIPYRNAAQRVLNRLGQTIKGMEYFGADSRKPLDVCLAEVRASKVYVGIIGMRYGSVSEGSGKSYTQLEYEEAVRCGVPTLIYLMDMDACPVVPKFVDTGKKGEALAAFKALLQDRHTVSLFTSPEDFSAKLTQDLASLLSKQGHTEEVKTVERDMQSEFEETFKRFLFRPAKYHGQEGILKIQISDKKKRCEAALAARFVKKLGLTPGDTVAVEVRVLDHKTDKAIGEGISIYGDQRCGDWIEEVPAGTSVSVKVRLDYMVYSRIEKYEGGSMRLEPEYKSLVLIAVP